MSFPHGKVVKQTQNLQAGIYCNILFEVLLEFCNGFPLDSATCSLFYVPAGMTLNYLCAKFNLMGKALATPRLHF